MKNEPAEQYNGVCRIAGGFCILILVEWEMVSCILEIAFPIQVYKLYLVNYKPFIKVALEGSLPTQLGDYCIVFMIILKWEIQVVIR